MAAIVKLEGCYGYGEYNFSVVEMRDLTHEHLGLAIMRFAHEPIKLLLGILNNSIMISPGDNPWTP